MCKLLVRCNETTPLAVVIWFRPIHISDSLISQSVSQWAVSASLYLYEFCHNSIKPQNKRTLGILI